MQLPLALSTGKPIILHTREAEADTLQLLKELVPSDYPLHLHCYTDTPALLQALLKDWTNLYVGFSGIVTFKNASVVRSCVPMVPLDRLLLETGPYRALLDSKRNYSA